MIATCQSKPCKRIFKNRKDWFEQNFKKSIGFIIVTIVCLIVLTGILLVVLTERKQKTFYCSFVLRSYPPAIDDLDSRPRSIVIEDLNHDQHPDLILLYSNANTLAIYLGHPDGTFDDPFRFFIGEQTRPVSLAVAHLNNDKHFDIVVVNARTHSISVFFGFGNGSLTINPINYSTSKSRPRQVLVADMNNDNRSDILVLADGTNEILVFLNVDNNSFSYWKSYETGFDSSPCFMSVADLDRDGHLDLVVANNGTNEILIFYAHKNITFSTGLNSHPIHLVLADVNDDEHFDLLVTKSGSQRIGIFLGLANGSFEQEMSLSTGRYVPSALGVNDFNQDGKKDLLILYESQNAFEIQIGFGNGNFSSEEIYSLSDISEPSSFALADLNNDFRSDLVLVSTKTNSFQIFFGENQPKFHSKTFERRHMIFVTAIDFNFDNHSDLVTIDNNMTCYVSFGFGNGSFSETKEFPLNIDFYSTLFFLKDLNNDRRMDFLIYDENSTEIFVLLQDFHDSFQSALISQTDFRFSSLVDFRTADVNNDDHVDLIFIDTKNLLLVVFISFGNGTFHRSGIQSNLFRMSSIDFALADMNEDERIDIVVGTYELGLTILFGCGNGSFIDQSYFPSFIGSTLVSLTIDDLNDDQHFDVLVVYFSTSHIGLWLGDGRGNLTKEQIYVLPENSFPYKLFTGDFNGDKRCDLLVLCFQNSSMMIFLGFANGSFQSEIVYPIDSRLNAMVITDFNQDGRFDLFVGLENSTETMKIYMNYDGGAQISSKLYTTGSASHPIAIATADVNNDHRSDLFVVNSGTESISLRIAHENQSFVSKTIYETGEGSSPRAIVLADFNEDERIDFAIANSGTNNIVVLIQQMNGSFLVEKTYSTGEQSRPTAMAVAHLNNDQWIDIAVANGGTNTINVFFGFRFSIFVDQTVAFTDSGSGPGRLVVADFNNDQLTDIAVVNTDVSSISLFLGQTSRQFSSQLKFSTGENSQPKFIAAADLDKNNRSDLVVISIQSNTMIIFLNLNTLTWDHRIVIDFGIDVQPDFFLIDDVNHDGNFDLIVSFPNSFEIRIWIGLGNGSFPSMIVLNTTEQLRSDYLLFGHFNQDTFLDLIVIDTYRNRMGTFKGNGLGHFTLVGIDEINSTTIFQTIASADLNGDTFIDLIVSSFGTDKIEIFLGTSNGTFVNQIFYSNRFFSRIYAIDVGDFNEDEHMDLIFTIAGADEGLIYILYGFGDGTFREELKVPLSFMAFPFAVIVDDVDHDNHLDFVVSIMNINTVLIAFGHCCVSFNEPVTLYSQMGAQATSIVIAGIDLIVSYAQTNSIGIFYNRGNKTFENQTIFLTSTKTRPSSMAVHDINNDHQLDLIVALDDDQRIDIYLGDQNRRFTLYRSYATSDGSRPRSLLMVDLNNDTYVDIVLTNDGTNSIGFLLSQGNGSFHDIIHSNTGFDSQPFAIARGYFIDDAVDLAFTMFQSNSIGVIDRECRYQ